jgi:uncharacterized protein (TIGR03435 family)
VGPAIAQEAQGTATPAFDVATLKPSGVSEVQASGPGQLVFHTRNFRFSGDRVTCDLPLKSIIAEAYSVKDFQISGPGWIDGNTYEVNALVPQGTQKEAIRLMLQTMLEQRLRFKYHREVRDVQVYVLVPAKGDSKLTPVADPEEHKAQQKERTVDTPKGPMKGVTSFQDRGRFMAVASSMDEFAQMLRNRADRPIVNLTNLKGAYDIDLRWLPNEDMTTSTHLDADLLKVMERQLGLKLESRKLPYDVIVIDQINKLPIDN